MALSPSVGAPLLEQSQAQKEVTLNEALMRVDALLGQGAIDKDLATPPGSPASGDVYIVAASPTGAWSGKAGQIAYYDQGWRFIVPKEGMMRWVRDEDVLYVHNGSNWASFAGGGGGPSLLHPRILACSGVAASTSATSEATLATISIPAGAMGANGMLRITTHWSGTNSANNKTHRIRLGGTAFFNVSVTTSPTCQALTLIRNCNSASSQIGWVNSHGGYGVSGSTRTSGTVNTAAAVDLTITAFVASGADTVTLDGYLVEVIYAA